MRRTSSGDLRHDGSTCAPRLARAPLALAALLSFAIACGGGTPKPFTGGADGGGASASDDGGAPSTSDDDAATGFTFPSDGGLVAPGSVGPCTAGTYAGTFSCDVTILGLFHVPLDGPISLGFVQQQVGGGEFTSLGIAPGAKMNATDNNGDVFAADLAGSLDCGTGKLTGTLVNATFTGGSGLGLAAGKSIAFTGALSGNYSGLTAPPSIADGSMGPLTSADLGGDAGPAAACTWSAKLQ